MIEGLKNFQELFLSAKRNKKGAMDEAIINVSPLFRNYGRRYKQVYRIVMQDEEDLMQVGLLEMVRAIEKYTFRCRCGTPLKTEKAFIRHCYAVHGCLRKPKTPIWRYVDFNCRRYMRNAMKIERKTDRNKGIPYDPAILDRYEGLWESEDTIASRILLKDIFEKTKKQLDDESVSVLWSVLSGMSYREIALVWSKPNAKDIKRVSKEIGRKARQARLDLGQIITEMDIEHL